MKNPLRSLYEEICKVIFRCPYWRRCPHFNRDKCHEAWINGECGAYRKFENEDGEKTAKFAEGDKNK